MKFTFQLLLIALLVALAYAATEQKSVVVSYPKDTPDSVVDQAKAAIKEAGGMITHEYNIIKAFAATAPAKALQNIQVMGEKYNAIVEEDQVYTVAGSSS